MDERAQMAIDPKVQDGDINAALAEAQAHRHRACYLRRAPCSTPGSFDQPKNVRFSAQGPR